MKRILSPGWRTRRGERLDLENVAEELEGMARSDRREIRSRLSILLTHLLKCAAHPKKPPSSWLGTIADQRDEIADLIEDGPKSTRAGCPVEPKAELSKTNVVRFRLSEYKLL
jgi:Domain of unknown function DUF29